MIDALAFFGQYPFRKLFIEDLVDVVSYLMKKGFEKIYVAYISSLFYRDPLEANRIAEKIFREAIDKVSIPRTYLLAGHNPSYLPTNKFFLEKLLDPVYKAYIIAPAYHGFNIGSRDTIRFIEYMCGENKRVVILDLLEDLREMHRGYILRFLIKKGQFEQFLRSIDKICGRKILLSSFRYDLLRDYLGKISDLEIYVDVSSDTLYGYQYDRVRELVSSLGEDLVLLATKTPISYPEASLYRVIYSDLPSGAKEKILWRNSIDFYEK